MTPHIEAKKEDIAKTVIMPGDPLRAKFIAEKSVQDYNWKLGKCIDEKVLIFNEIENDLLKEQYLKAIELGESYIINSKPNRKS